MLSLWFRDALGHPPPWLYPIGHPALVLGSGGTIEGIFATVTGHARRNEEVGSRTIPLGMTCLWTSVPHPPKRPALGASTLVAMLFGTPPFAASAILLQGRRSMIGSDWR